MILSRRMMIDAAAIALVGALTGVAVNHRLLADALAGRLAAPAPAAPGPGVLLPQPVVLAEVRDLIAAGALPVDARDAQLFAEGHLPGAYSLPLGELGAARERFREQVAAERTLVIYCSGYGCPDSFDLGEALLAMGYRQVRVFEGGFPEWRDAGLPVVKGD